MNETQSKANPSSLDGQHTPGPWYRNIRAGGKYPVIFAGRNTHVAVAQRMPTPEETEANIDLIAAAPELLATLEATLPALILLGDYIGNEFAGKVGIEAFDRCAIIGAARDAIAKARGQS